jgi:nucleotide-binding universal stress UspA family protein
MYASVLVPLDGSEAAAAAVPHALAMARQFGSRLVFLRVVDEAITSQGSGSYRDYEAQRSQAEGYLDVLKRSLQNEDLSVDRIVGSGDPAAVILQTAKLLGRPLIVITAVGRTARPEIDAIGSVANDVLRHAGGAVVLVRPEMATAQAVDERRLI